MDGLLQKGSIYLCGRADGEPTRSFSGAVSHLSVYSTVLSATQIRALYRSVVLGTFAAWSAAAAPIGAPGSAPSMGVDLSLPSVGFANAPAALTAGPLAAAAAPQVSVSLFLSYLHSQIPLEETYATGVRRARCTAEWEAHDMQ